MTGKKSYPSIPDQNRLTNSGACMFISGKKAIIVVMLRSDQSMFGVPATKLATATITVEILTLFAPVSAESFSSSDMTSCEFRIILRFTFTAPC